MARACRNVPCPSRCRAQTESRMTTKTTTTDHRVHKKELKASGVCRKRMAAFVAEHGRVHPSQRLSWGPLKEFSDGALGSATALLHQPYTHQPHTAGLAVIDFAELSQLIGNASQACLQVLLLLQCPLSC